MEEWEPMNKPLRDLIEIIRFTESVAAKIHGLLDEADIYRTVTEEFAQSKRYTASILLLTDDGSSLRIAETALPPEKVEAGEKAAGVRLKGYKIDLNKSSIYRQVAREGKTLQVNVSDVISELFPRPLAYLVSKTMGYEKKPSVLTPLKRRGEIIGVLSMSSTELGEHLIPSVRSLAQHISTALDLADENAQRVQAEEALERRVAELSALNAMAAIVAESLDVDEILNRAIDEALRLVGVEAGAMMLLDEEAGEVVMVAHSGMTDEMVRGASRFKLGEGLTGQVAQTGEAAVLDLAKYPDALKGYIEKHRIRSAAVVPLIGSDGVIGTMNLASASSHYFDAAGLELLVALGRQIAIGVEKARLSQETFRVVAENASDGIFITAGEGVQVYANQRVAEITGYSVAELLKTTIKDLVHPDEFEKIMERYRKRLAGEPVPRQYETIIVRKDGQSVPIELTAAKTVWRGQPADMVIIRDITERKQAEERVKHLNAVLRAIRNVNQLIVREEDRDRLLPGVCESLIETRGYYHAWIALVDESGALVAAAEAGLGESFLPLVEQLKRGQPTYCTRRALAQADVLIIEDPLSTCSGCPLSSGHSGRGGMAVRLEHGGKIYGLLTVSAPAGLVADKEERALFEEVARDIAIALHSIELEEQRKQAEEELRRRAEELERINAELERFNRLAVGREQRMIELKRQVNALAEALGQAPPYDLSFVESR